MIKLIDESAHFFKLEREKKLNRTEREEMGEREGGDLPWRWTGSVASSPSSPGMPLNPQQLLHGPL
jgi:hypothetical protein